MSRKIKFDVGIANDFDETGRWPKPIGATELTSVDIEFEFLGNDVMVDAEEALKEFMVEHYPTKKYKINYWTWLN